MKRHLISAGIVIAALTVAVLVGGAVPGSVRADATRAQSGELVTQQEFCAFRAPLFVDADDVPAGCVSVVEWLRRVITADMACGDLWLQRGAIPDCALPYR